MINQEKLDRLRERLNNVRYDIISPAESEVLDILDSLMELLQDETVLGELSRQERADRQQGRMV